MKTITIRGVPDELHAELQRRAKRNRRSLNQQMIEELGQRVEEKQAVSPSEKGRQRAEEMIATVDALRGRLTRFATAEEIDQGKRYGRE